MGRPIGRPLLVGGETVPKVKVKETHEASANGITISTYEAGQVYDMPPRLADMFIANGWGTDAKVKAGPSETKAGE